MWQIAALVNPVGCAPSRWQPELSFHTGIELFEQIQFRWHGPLHAKSAKGMSRKAAQSGEM